MAGPLHTGWPGAPGVGDVAPVVVEQAHVHLGDDPARGLEPVLAVVAHRGAAQRAGLVGAVELQHPRAGDVLEARGPLVRAPPRRR